MESLKNINSIEIECDTPLSPKATHGLVGTEEEIDAFYCNRSSLIMGASLGILGELAAGRLNWLLSFGRFQLHGMFSAREIEAMVRKFEGGWFTISEIESLSSEVFEVPSLQNNLEVDAVATKQLSQKLSNLDALEAMALADLLEMIRNSGMEEDRSTPVQFLEQIGFPLSA